MRAARHELASRAEYEALSEWTRDLALRRGVVVPAFDPAEAGTSAQVLVLHEAPGPMTNATGPRAGSGFISVDNDDQTAENMWRLRAEVGLSEQVTLHWNIVPWYLGAASVKPNAQELRQGALELRRLLPLLPRLRIVVASGRHAQEGWRKDVSPFVSDIRVIDTWHPSPLAMNQPGKRDEFRRALERAVRAIS